MVWDNCREFAPDVVAAYDSHCHCGSAASNTDRRTSRSPQSFVDWRSVVDSEIDGEAIADGLAIEYCCIATLMQLMQDLNYKITNFISQNSNEFSVILPEGLQKPASSSPFGFEF